MAVKGGDDGLDDAADNAEHVLNGDRDNQLGLVEAEDDRGQDAETVEDLEVGTDLGTDVDKVGAALLAEGDAVALAGAKTELAEGELGLGDEAELEGGKDVVVEDLEAVDLGVEEGDGVGDLFNVEAVETGADGLELGRDLALDVNLGAANQVDLGADLGVGDKGDGVEAGLAVLVRGVVAADLGGGDGAELGELDVDAGVDIDGGLGPGARDGGAGALLTGGVPAQAGLAAAGLGPRAVGHGVGAAEALDRGVDLGLEAGVDLDTGANTLAGTDTSTDGSVDIDTSANTGTNTRTSTSTSGDAGVHVDTGTNTGTNTSAGTDSSVDINVGVDAGINGGTGIKAGIDTGAGGDLGVNTSIDVGGRNSGRKAENGERETHRELLWGVYVKRM